MLLTTGSHGGSHITSAAADDVAVKPRKVSVPANVMASVASSDAADLKRM
jgi:hypothetical protein